MNNINNTGSGRLRHTHIHQINSRRENNNITVKCAYHAWILCTIELLAVRGKLTCYPVPVDVPAVEIIIGHLFPVRSGKQPEEHTTVKEQQETEREREKES